MMRSRWGRFIVAGRFMRGFYGVVKAATFGWIFLIQPWPAMFPDLWLRAGNAASLATDLLVYVCVALCIIRGVPVILECLVETNVLKLNNKPAANALDGGSKG